MSNYQQIKEKVFLVIQSILEIKYHLIARLLCFNHRFGGKEHFELYKMAIDTGFRSSEA